MIALDFDAPYGEITLMLDGVNTTGDMMFSPMGDSTIFIKGDVTTGTIFSGLNHGVHVHGAEGEQTNTLTVNSPKGYGVTTSTDICIENLDALYVNTGLDGIYSEEGRITIQNVSGAITAGEDCAAMKSDNPNASIVVNGNEIVGGIGSIFRFEGNVQKS